MANDRDHMNRLAVFFACALVLSALSSADAAKKAPPAPAYPPAAEQQAFAEQYYQALDGGQGAMRDFEASVYGAAGAAGDIKAKMLENLKQGKGPDGNPLAGFRGDPTDQGPRDWSDWDIQTDADGNVTGFKEKDFEQKDADGNGEISDAERAEWDKKKAKEHEEAGGAPGEVDPPPDWDKDRDGKPDPGFERDCWQCVMPAEPLNECVDGAPGPCDSHACDQDEECREHEEEHNGKKYTCHNCGPKEEQLSFCEACGFSSDPACGGECQNGPCVPIDLDKKSCDVVPTMQTRERGSTQQCYTCMRVTEVVIEYIVIIIETPFERYVLDKGKKEGFTPSSVMALAKVDQATGKIQNTVGELKAVTDFLGGFNVGWGPMGLSTTGKVSMDQLSGMLGKGLGGGGSFGSNCFDDVLKEADGQAASQGTPTSADIEGKGKERKENKAKSETEVFSGEQMKKADAAGDPAVTGPIVACGNEGRNKVLRIYDASGALVDTITQAMFKADPSIITQRLGKAQGLADMFIKKSGIDFAGYIEKFTGLPLKDMQAVAAKASQIKSQVDQAVGMAASKKKKKGQEELPPLEPNDPLFYADYGKKKSAVKETMKKVAANPLSMGGMRMGGGVLGGGSMTEEDRASDKPEINDQWGIRKVGFTEMSDPNSAWNVVDPTQKNVVVAVVDSGLDMAHPDGPQYLWTNPKETPGNGVDDDQNGFVDDIHGWNFLDENHDFTDVRGHGTFVAGIIAAKMGNGIGIAGINPGAVIMPLKVADDEGKTDSLSIYRGINYAVNHGAKIINVSLGGRVISKLEQQAVDRAGSLGALVIVAAGNGNDNIMTFGPSSSKRALAVGQIDYNGQRSTVSNWGPNLGLVAPGEQIYSLCSKDNKHVLPSLRKEGYYKQDGTSFSTPMVAATASLIWAKDPSLTNQQVVDLILGTASDMGETGWDGMTGAGLLNASAALRASATDELVAMLTTLRVNKDVRDKPVSIDVYGTVRGRLKDFTIEVGKGKNPGRFSAAAGPFQQKFDAQHIARLSVRELMRGSKDWVIRIKAVDMDGKEHIASTPFELAE